MAGHLGGLRRGDDSAPRAQLGAVRVGRFGWRCLRGKRAEEAASLPHASCAEGVLRAEAVELGFGRFCARLVPLDVQELQSWVST
jgi:hypothetical protein